MHENKKRVTAKPKKNINDVKIDNNNNNNLIK